MKKIVITGGAGYIGSPLTGLLLAMGHQVIVIDKLLFGGDHMLCYKVHGNRFDLIAEDVMDIGADRLADICSRAAVVVHLAGLVGFPICQQVGEAVAKRYNEDTASRMFDAADSCGVQKFVFSSTYSNYGASPDGKPVDEKSPLNPQSLYAETKIATEEMLLGANGQCKPVIFRFSTLFGLSPRTRLDLIVNQFVLEAIKKGKIIIYQKDYRRSFIHVNDIVRCVVDSIMRWGTDECNEVWNVGSNKLNLSKEQVIALIKKQIPLEVEYKDLTFGGDMRDITVSFDKIKERVGFEPRITVEDGITELKDAIETGILKNPFDDKYRNAKFIVS
jgi:nucleoside-diphosphate-sugar epimerase